MTSRDAFLPFTLAHRIGDENFSGFSIPLRTLRGTGYFSLSQHASAHPVSAFSPRQLQTRVIPLARW